MIGFTLIVAENHDLESEVSVCTVAQFATVNVKSFVSAPLSQLADGLSSFSNGQIPAKFDYQFGQFGSRYAGGAALLQFNYARAGEIVVTIDYESEYFLLAGQHLADRASLHFRTEPVLLDNFIDELLLLIDKKINVITLEGIARK